MFVAFSLTTGRGAQTPPCEFEGVARIVAVGDVHGAYGRLVEILRAAGVIDRADRWSAGRTHFVQLGDVLDRGPDSRKVLDLYRRLEREASNAGGRVHVLMGNHEAMRVLGDLRYVAPGEYQAFATGSSSDLRAQAVASMPLEQRARLLADTPLGMIELIRAFGASEPYGSFLRKLNAVVRINGFLFLHGGISPAVASLRCAAINDTIRRELSRDLSRTQSNLEASLVGREDGPLWYRGLALEPDTFGPQVDRILAAQQASAVVIGHTVQPEGRIVSRFGGKVFLVDTGMLEEYVPTGRASALEIRGNVFTAIYTDRRDVIAGARAPGAQVGGRASERR